MQKTHSPPDYSAPAMIPPIVSSGIPWKVKDVAVVGDRRLHVRFNDGTEGDVDLSDFLKRDDKYLGVFVPLRDPAFFSRVGLCHGAVTWPGEIDLAPDNMYRIIKKHGEYRL